MDRELAPLAKNGSINSSEKQQQGDGELDKTENSYGANLFYWVCDCAAVKEVLDYEGSISIIK